MASNSKSRACLCSPTAHPGSFRCTLHRNRRKISTGASIVTVSTSQWESATSAKADALKAFLLHFIKPSGNDPQRRRNFHPKPSRFCLMNDHHSGLAVS